VDGPALYGAPLALGYLFLATSVIATPALIGGFRRRGTGRVYEPRFSIQRAPQLIVALNVCVIFFAFHVLRSLAGPSSPDVRPIAPFAPNWFFSLAHLLPASIAWVIAWSGVALSAFGVLLLVSGWYALGENLSTDAELLHHQTLCTNGIYAKVMHPVYAGVMISLLGAALVPISPACGLVTLGVVTPLFVRRALYEERLLEAHFGEPYTDYAARTRRRFVPAFVPFGF
jgi:protein-S-isoprenylcysteine O-methyltransferase Ste14